MDSRCFHRDYNICLNYYKIGSRAHMWGFGKRIVYHIQQFNSSKDYYKILGISKEATKDQIKKSFRDLAKIHHPDSKNGNQQKFKEINEAYQILSSQQIKNEYDASQNKSQQIKKSAPRPQSKKTQGSSRSYQKKYDKKRQKPGFEYDEENPEQFRQFMRKQMNEEVKRYTQKRNTYDNLGRTYDNYEQFKQYTLNKKTYSHNQKFKVTLDSVKKQQDLYRAHRQARERQQMQKKAQNLKKDLEQRLQRAKQNTQNTIEGIKKVGVFIKDFFTKK